MSAKAKSPHEVNPRPKTGLGLLKGLAAQQTRLLRLSIGFGLVSNVCMIVQWLSLAYLAQQIIVDHLALVDCWSAILLFAVGAVLRPVFLRFKNNAAQTASWQARQQVRQQILLAWQQSSPLMQHQHSPAAAATQWVEEVEAMDAYFSQYLPQQMLAVWVPVLILVVVFYFNWLCGLLLLISAPLIPTFMILVGLGAESINQKYFVMRQRLAGHFLDRVKHLATIKLFNAQHTTLDEIAQKSDDYREVIMRTLKIAFLSSTVLEFFTSVAIASVAIYIGFSLFGAITWGPSAELNLFSGLAILLLAPEFFQPLRHLSQCYHDRAAALAASTSLISALPDIDHLTQHSAAKSHGNLPGSSSALRYQNIAQGMQVVDLTYGYTEALQAPISFALSPGDIMCISGPSGSGKSTLLHTLTGYLPPLQGDIFLPVDNIAEPKVAFLPQHAWLMHDSVLNNILLFAPNASREGLNTYLQSLDLADEFTQREQGLNTGIGDSGLGFSGGQGQRIALLRLMFAPTPLIILDEPSASLDEQNRHRVIEQLRKLAKHAIVIVASHDEEIIKIANHHLRLSAANTKTGDQYDD